ncbi:MAG: sigma-54-dependent Fis family transcriptional regulator [Alcanivoracaceae bacterium]|nr:sigma-54-dependent Fis family transcriptional regulator [Alcanivoracaceae bacterium]
MNQDHILIVDDEPDIRNLISDILADEGYSVATAANGEEAGQQLNIKQPQLILLDIWMPDIDGISLMKKWNEQKLVTAPIVMMSGHATVETAVEATRLGAKDFIEKPLSLAKLLQTVSDTLRQSEQALDDNHTDPTAVVIEPIGNSELIKQIKAALIRIYKTKNHIMIEGENGTGKYSTALLIHQKRYAKTQPCIVMDAQTVDHDFKDKIMHSNGYFIRAGSGTLIINNIDRLTIEQQNILLSALKHKQFTVLGQNTVRPINFQIVAISKSQLNSQIAKGEFLSDLYQLIAEVKLNLPSLLQRQEDIPELITYFVNTLPDTEQTPYRKISFAAQNRLRNLSWINNIQELKNTVRQLQLLDGEGEISLDDVNTLLTQTNQIHKTQFNNWYDLPLREAREAFERDYLIHQLKAVDGRVGELAKVAGMERTHLYRKLRTLNINPKDIVKP